MPKIGRGANTWHRVAAVRFCGADKYSMSELPSVKDLTDLAGLLAPGIVILWVRGRFRDAFTPKFSEQIGSYAIISLAYNAVAYPLFHAEQGLSLPEWLWQFLFRFLVPLLVAVVVVFFDRSERFYKFMDRIGLRPVHHTPTAWEYTFRNRPPAYVLVHLTDGSTVAGTWYEGSFASHKAEERDLLLEDLRRIDEDGKWSVFETPRSMLICGGTIRMVEFIQGGSQ